MPGSCPSILLVTFSFFFLLSIFIAPQLTSTLNTQVQCLDQPNSKYKRCVYCWSRPLSAHPLKPIDLQLPFTNFQFLSTKSCTKITCVESLQFFGNSNSIQTSLNVEQYLNITNSQVQHHAREFKRIPNEIESWKIFVTLPTSSHLPPNDGFVFPNDEIVSRLIIAELVAVLITWGAFILSFLSAQKVLEYKDISCSQIMGGMLSIFLLYTGYNFLEEWKLAEMIVVGIAKGLFMNFIMSSLSSTSLTVSILNMIIIIGLSVYQAYYPAMFTGIYLVSCAVMIFIKSISYNDQWPKESIIALISLFVFCFSQLILTLDEYYFWRIVRIYSIGIGVGLVYTIKINPEQEMKMDQKSYEGVIEEGSIAEIGESPL